MAFLNHGIHGSARNIAEGNGFGLEIPKVSFSNHFRVARIGRFRAFRGFTDGKWRGWPKNRETPLPNGVDCENGRVV